MRTRDFLKSLRKEERRFQLDTDMVFSMLVVLESTQVSIPRSQKKDSWNKGLMTEARDMLILRMLKIARNALKQSNFVSIVGPSLCGSLLRVEGRHSPGGHLGIPVFEGSETVQSIKSAFS